MCGWNDATLTSTCPQADVEVVLATLALSHLEVTVRDVGLYPDAHFRDTSSPSDQLMSLFMSTNTVTETHPDLSPSIVAPAPGTRVRPVSCLLLSRAERTLDDFDVWAFAKRLAESIPTLDSASFVAQRPRRCGGVDRVATLLPRVQTGELTPERGRITYKEVRHGVLGVERFGIESSSDGSME